MKFEITRTSQHKYKEEKEINTLGELLEFVDEHQNVIITAPFEINDYKRGWELEIYDDYRE